VAVVPSSDPAPATPSKSSGMSSCSAVSSGVDEPPGVQNLRLCPGSMPPASSISSRSVMPSPHSYCPGLAIRPDSE
jgi:hypothetical protein